MAPKRKVLAVVGILWSGALLTGAGAALAATHAAEAVQPPALENSVVKIFSTMRYPDPFKPWTKQAPSEATASGVVIEGRRILTNAHAVLYASQVQDGIKHGSEEHTSELQSPDHLVCR